VAEIRSLDSCDTSL